MKLYFLKDVRASFAPNQVFKSGHVYDVATNNTPTMLENNFAIPEGDRPKQKISLKKPTVKPPRKKRTYKKK
jgi:hypothetical protein